MRPEFDSFDNRYDSYDSRDDSYDSYDSYPDRVRPPARTSIAGGVIALCFAAAGLLGLLGCYGCVYGDVTLVRGAQQGQAMILFPLLLLAFLACALVSVVTLLVGLLLGVASLFNGRANRNYGIASLVIVLAWVGGVWWLVWFLANVK